MPSSDALHPEQLRMFIPAGELTSAVLTTKGPLKGDFVPGDFEPGPDFDYAGTWRRKLKESHKPADLYYDDSRYDAVATEGVTKPIQLMHSSQRAGFRGNRQRAAGEEHWVIVDGHHRIAAASDIDPQMEVPVEYPDITPAERGALRLLLGGTSTPPVPPPANVWPLATVDKSPSST